MRLVVHNSAALTLAIILIGGPARSQSVPSCPVSANDLARQVITNELKFQDDHTNWMYRLEKEQYGKKQVEEIIETKEGSLSRLLSINDRSLNCEATGRRGPSRAGANDQSKCETKIAASHWTLRPFRGDGYSRCCLMRLCSTTRVLTET